MSMTAINITQFMYFTFMPAYAVESIEEVIGLMLPDPDQNILTGQLLKSLGEKG